jgi:ATP-dependent Lon protease
VLIPQENVKDLPDIPANVRELLHIQAVQNIDQVLALALERQPHQQAPSQGQNAAGSASVQKPAKKPTPAAKRGKSSATISPRSAPRKAATKRNIAPLVLPSALNEKTKKIRSEKTKH